MFTADQLVAHAVGDYILQSDWMANQKTKQTIAALIHATLYSLVFLLFRPSITAFTVILVSHFLIDRFRLARYVVWLKNQMKPGTRQQLTATGYPDDAPFWLTVWLLIIADNILHVLINGAALRWL